MVHMLRIAMLVLIGATLVAPPVSAGGARCDDEGFTDRRVEAVNTKGGCFLPTVARVDVGTTVSWRVADDLPHTVTGAAGAFGAQQPAHDLSPSQPVSVTFDTPGVYPYVCLLHPGMAGAVVVGDAQATVATSGLGDVGVGRPAPAAALSTAGVLVLVLVSGGWLARRRRHHQRT